VASHCGRFCASGLAGSAYRTIPSHMEPAAGRFPVAGMCRWRKHLEYLADCGLSKLRLRWGQAASRTSPPPSAIPRAWASWRASSGAFCPAPAAAGSFAKPKPRASAACRAAGMEEVDARAQGDCRFVREERTRAARNPSGLAGCPSCSRRVAAGVRRRSLIGQQSCRGGTAGVRHGLPAAARSSACPSCLRPR